MAAERRNVQTLAGMLLAVMVTAVPVAARAPDAAPAATDEYVMGVFPHLPPRDLEEVFAPIVNDLSVQLGRHVVLRASTTYERFTEQLEKQEFDIAFVQPFEYVRIADKYGYMPLATRTEKLAAITAVKPDSPLTKIADLKNRRIALPPETAAVTHLFLGQLRAAGINPAKDVKLSHHRSHVSCLQQVIIGEADACVTAAPALRFFVKKMNTEMKVIASSREIPHTLFTVHPRVAKKDREVLRARIIGWNDTEQGKELLARGQLTPFVAVSDADYNVVRELAR